MINKWTISNFKSIQQETALEFSPLTLFVGQNSSGKSTLIQSILMTAQTLQNNVTTRSVVLNGKIVKLGAFSDIHSNDAKSDAISISFELKRSEYQSEWTSLASRIRYYSAEYHDVFGSVHCSYKFSAGGDLTEDRSLQLQPRLESGGIGYSSSANDIVSNLEYKRIDGTPASLLQKIDVSAIDARIPTPDVLSYQITSKVKQAYRSNVVGFNDLTKPAGISFRHFLPTNIALSYDALEVEVAFAYDFLAFGTSRYDHISQISKSDFNPLTISDVEKYFTEACINALPVGSSELSISRLNRAIQELKLNFHQRSMNLVHAHLTLEGRKKLPSLLGEKEEDIKRLLRSERKPRNEISMFALASPISYATDYLTNFFVENVKYLGPLRDEPKSIYPLLGYNDPTDVGYRGEFTAAVLDNNKNTYVNYVPSSGFPFSTQDKIRTGSTTLYTAVSDWLDYLGIASKVETEDKGKFGHEMTIKTQSSHSEKLHDLTHVGVGVSQALPIVVLSLLADSGSTLIFEQPELHLHPKVQTRLADFFMSLVFSGKQCIVETHSEYLISRLRYLSAMAENVELSKQIKIYFVNKPKNQSIYTPVTISETGVIKNWPEGFFDETEKNSASIIQAQLDRAKSKKKLQRPGEQQ
ncbi:AAA family ATPase [Pseudoduganella namucuonensis]|uniref:DUF3696 domain-containing protein n=1 Tax=Pseudoduganella namucuonensis TaxID=1035707 RepID=A0A1I7F7E3_9BURK|nr:DUF3696 domain-containing protein [Pseudoduganella namucuonensis]SFU32074.1 Protein of unknown function [Pseudoduganella namucuonensis]